MGYWARIAKRAVKEALSDLRLGLIPVAVSFITQAIIGLILLAVLRDASPVTRIASALAPFLAFPLIFAFRLFTVPAQIDREQRAKIIPRPFDETPLFKLTYCAPEEREGRRTAVAKIEYTKDIKGGQLKVWGYENRASRHRIEAHDSVNEMKDHVHTIALATVAIVDRSVPNRWGKDGETFGETFGENEPKLVVIEMTEGAVRQEVRIQVIAIMTGTQCNLRVFSPDWNPYFWPDPLPVRVR